MLSKAKIQFFSITLQIPKNLSKQAMTLIFFQRKLRVHTLRIWKGGHSKANFSLKFQLEIDFPEKAESPYFTNLEKGGQKGAKKKSILV